MSLEPDGPTPGCPQDERFLCGRPGPVPRHSAVSELSHTGVTNQDSISARFLLQLFPPVLGKSNFFSS